MAQRLALLLLAGMLGCATPTAPTPHPFAEADYPGELRAPSAMSGNFMWRQHLRAEWPTGSHEFEAVLQKQGNTLTLVGLNGLGQVGFVITQTGTDIVVEHRGGPRLPFPARFILLDVQRVYFPWLPEGMTHGQVGGEEITESWADGVRTARVFRRIDDKPPGTITVQFEAGVDGAAPTKVRLDNRWFDYRLFIETLSQEILPEN